MPIPSTCSVRPRPLLWRRIAAGILATLLVLSLAPAADAASSPSERAFVSWYHASPANVAWFEWVVWMRDPANASYFQWKQRAGLHPAIAAHFGTGHLGRQAQAIAQCESELLTTAVSPTNDHGLFQINAVHRRSFTVVTGLAWSAIYDAYANASFARNLYDRQGWSPWTCRYVL